MEGPHDASVVLQVHRAKAPATVDQDFLLARALQEQEHAFMLLQSGHYGVSGANDGWIAEGGSEPDEGADDPEHDPEAGQRGSARAGDGAGMGEPGEEMEEDAGLARRLQDEEQCGLYERMLEMSGYPARPEEAQELNVDALTYEDLQALGEVAGSVSRGLAAAAIGRLPQVSFKQLSGLAAATAVTGSDGETQREGPADGAAAAGLQGPLVVADRCTICLADFEDDDLLKVLSCKHAYHSGCLDSWLGVNKACPVCAKEVAAESLKPC